MLTVDIGQHLVENGCCDTAYFIDKTIRRIGQENAFCTPVAGIGTPFDETTLFQPIDIAGHRHRLDAEPFGQLSLSTPIDDRDMKKGAGFARRDRQARLADPPLHGRTQQSADIGNDKSEGIGIDGAGHGTLSCWTAR